MDFLVHKFSDWLKVNHIEHELIQVKGGYIIHFKDPSNELKEIITSLAIQVDTGKEDDKGLAITAPLATWTNKGDGIVFDEKHYASVINASYDAIRNYIYNKNIKAERKSLSALFFF